MAFELTASEVKEIIPDLQASNAALELAIAVASEKLDDCLASCYGESSETAKAIKIYASAYIADKGHDNKGSITAKKWADGDSINYSAPTDGNAYWNTALQLDSCGCMAKAFRSGKVFATTGRTVRNRFK